VEVAPWENFGIGGTNTIRGWDFAARKGKNQMLNTIEYRYTLLEPRGWDLLDRPRHGDLRPDDPQPR